MVVSPIFIGAYFSTLMKSACPTKKAIRGREGELLAYNWVMEWIRGY